MAGVDAEEGTIEERVMDPRAEKQEAAAAAKRRKGRAQPRKNSW